MLRQFYLICLTLILSICYCVYIVLRFPLLLLDLKEKLNTNGWDGRWYKRAITDDGQELGSSTSDECKIDSIAQSWSVFQILDF